MTDNTCYNMHCQYRRLSDTVQMMVLADPASCLYIHVILATRLRSSPYSLCRSTATALPDAPRRACIEPVSSLHRPLHRRILEDPEFRAGQFDTKFMERFFAREKARREDSASS